MKRAIPSQNRTVLATALFALLAAGVTPATDWPQFRGPDQDGISTEQGLLDVWPAEGPAVVWRRPLGGGFSGITLVDGRLYTMFADGGQSFLGCFDAASGEQLWRVDLGKAFKDRFGAGPRATPTVADGMVFALSARGRLQAVSAADGKGIWHHDLVEAFGANIPQWGIAASPLVQGNRVLVQVGAPDALFVAFDRKTGKELWRSGGGKAGYAAPLALSVGGVPQVVFFAANAIHGIDPESGRELWRKPWKTDWDVNAAMPVFIEPDRLFVSSGYDTGAALFRLGTAEGGAAIEEVWQARDMKNQFSSSVLHGEHLYGFDNKILKCVSVANGETVWRARDLGHGSLIYADGRLIVLGEQGDLVLVEATPDAYREKSRFKIFDDKTWTVPTLSGGRLYLRDEKELLALDVAGS